MGMELLQSLFVKPIPVTGLGRLGMLLPLVLSISIVYKTIRCDRVSQIPAASLFLCFTILVCMGLIGVFLLAMFNLLA
ncbi:MAG TPA: hypothetical protein VJZ71_04905 [Phycisphaerae bacterium]|nr:hypothetical protein [Phycisphaerae bacterium]